MLIFSSMKHAYSLLITSLLLTFSEYLNGQQCPTPNPSTGSYLHANNIRAYYTASGSQFFDGTDGQFKVFDDSFGITTIFAQGLWLGAKDADGDIRLALAQYGLASGQSDYYPGPVLPNGSLANPDCVGYDRVWSVYRHDIDAHLADFADNGMIDQPLATVMGWPGSGNANFADYYGFDLPVSSDTLAPFEDLNEDGIYQPELGEYPVEPRFGSVAEQLVWTVFNTVGGIASESGVTNPIDVEVQCTSWALACVEDTLINNSIFGSYRIINRGQEVLDSLRIGFWTDFDLGCFTDDYVGSAPELQTYFVYNEDNEDNESCSGNVMGFGENPPVQAVTILNQELDGFIGYFFFDAPPGAIRPQNSTEYWNYLNNRFKDGSRINMDGLGYNPEGDLPTNYLYSGDPTDTTQWSAISILPDRSPVLGTMGNVAGPTTWVPGASHRVDVGYSYHRQPGANFLENVTAMRAGVSNLLNQYNEPAPSECSLIPMCIDDCVWPGDLNADGIANHLDLIATFFGLGATGPTRSGPHFWSPRNGEIWNDEQVLGPNNKHLDANGDGVCSPADFEQTLLFYNYTRPDFVPEETQTEGDELAFVRTNGQPLTGLSPGQILSCRVRLNSPIQNLRAIAFRLEYDPFFYEMFRPSASASFSANFSREVAPGVLDMAIFKEEDLPTNENIELVQILVTLEGDIPPIFPTDLTCIEFKNIRAYLSDGTEVELGATKATLQIDGIVSTDDFLENNLIKLYPNPVVDQLNVEFNGHIPEWVEIVGATGQRYFLTEQVDANLSMANLPAGVYYLRFGWGQGVSTHKVVKQ